jgi:hypothetical protein
MLSVADVWALHRQGVALYARMDPEAHTGRQDASIVNLARTMYRDVKSHIDDIVVGNNWCSAKTTPRPHAPGTYMWDREEMAGIPAFQRVWPGATSTPCALGVTPAGQWHLFTTTTVHAVSSAFVARLNITPHAATEFFLPAFNPDIVRTRLVRAGNWEPLRQSNYYAVLRTVDLGHVDHRLEAFNAWVPPPRLRWFTTTTSTVRQNMTVPVSRFAREYQLERLGALRQMLPTLECGEKGTVLEKLVNPGTADCSPLHRIFVHAAVLETRFITG